MGEIMELTRNLSIYQCGQTHERARKKLTHTHKHAHWQKAFVQKGARAPLRTPAHSRPQEIWMEWIMKLPLTLFTYDSLSITQMDTTLSAIDHGPFFSFASLPLSPFFISLPRRSSASVR